MLFLIHRERILSCLAHRTHITYSLDTRERVLPLNDPVSTLDPYLHFIKVAAKCGSVRER